MSAIGNSERLYQKVAAQIAQKITSGDFPVETRLPTERKLAESLMVSRPTVREAMIALEIVGLIDIKGGSGSYVREVPQTAMDVEALFDVGHSPSEIIGTRLILEVDLAGQAALNATDADIEAMRDAVKVGWQDFETQIKRMESFANDADGKFHRAIASCSKNNLNTAIVRFLWKGLRSPLIRAMEDKAHFEQYAELPLLDHETILRAIENRDEDGAKNAMHRHLVRYQKLLGGSPE